MEDTVTLFRPTGPQELALVRQSGWKRWPPRPDWQPIFYPVLNEEYAVKITRDWNAKDPATGHRGYVTRFEVRTSFLDRYEVHRVGGRVHDEYWIPAAEVEGVNDNIVGDIEVISIFTGAPPAMVARSYQGPRLFCDFEDDMGSITLGVSLKRDQGITTFCDLDRPPGAVMLSHGEATNRLIDLDFGQARATFSWLHQLSHGQRPVWWGVSVRYEVGTDTAVVDLTGDERLCAAARWHDLRCDAKRWQISLGWTEGAGLVAVLIASAASQLCSELHTTP